MQKCPMCEENKPNVEFKTDMGDGDVMVCEGCYNDICDTEDDGNIVNRCDICADEVEGEPNDDGPYCCMSCQWKGWVWIDGPRKSLWVHKDGDEYAEYLEYINEEDDGDCVLLGCGENIRCDVECTCECDYCQKNRSR